MVYEKINLLGKPQLRYLNENEEILNKLGVKRVHVSLSHEDDVSIAFVVLEG